MVQYHLNKLKAYMMLIVIKYYVLWESLILLK